MILSLLIALVMATPSNDCPAEQKLPKELTPKSLEEFGRTYKITSPEALMCCIARDAKASIVIAHNSIAAQNGDYMNPRVLVVAREDDPEAQNGISGFRPRGRIQAMFSVNSGAAHLRQNKAVEMMFNDDQGNELSLFDIDLEEKSMHMSGKNPESCMACHSHANPDIVGGPFPIFDRFPWPRISSEPTTALQIGASQPFCPNRKKLDEVLTAKSRQALAENPRYRCLKNLKEEAMFDFDNDLAELNERRIAKWITKTKDFEKFKYAIFSLAMGCPKEVEEVLPPSALATMTNVSSIDSRIQKMTKGGEILSYLDKKRRKDQLKAQVDDLKNIRRIALAKQGKPLRMPQELDVSDQCLQDRATESQKLGLNRMLVPLLTPQQNIIKDKYVIDSAARESDGNMGSWRFLFESRGLMIRDWGMRLLPGYSRAPQLNLIKHLVSLEPNDSPLRRFSSVFNSISSSGIGVESGNCKELRKMSYRAFGEELPPETQQGTTVQ